MTTTSSSSSNNEAASTSTSISTSTSTSTSINTTHCIAGSITAGCFSTLIGHPLDTIKVLKQTKPAQFSSLSSFQVVKTLLHDFQLEQNQQQQQQQKQQQQKHSYRSSRNFNSNFKYSYKYNYNLFHILFRGIGSPMMNQIVMNSVMFSVFYKIKDVTSTNTNTNASVNTAADSDSDSNSGYLNVSMSETTSAFCAGLISGFVTAFLSTPTDWIKIQAQMSLSHNNNNNNNHSNNNNSNNTKSNNTKSNNINSARSSNCSSISNANTSMIRKNDVLSILKQLSKECKHNPIYILQTLYRGHTLNLAREGIFTMVYLGLYDSITTRCMNMNTNTNTNTGDYDYDNAKTKNLGMDKVVIISSFTGACAWICNYPFDTIKSVIQGGHLNASTNSGKSPLSSMSLSTSISSTPLQKISIPSAIQYIYRSGSKKSGGSWKAFYRGVGASTFRAMLVTSTRMLAYEKTIQLLATAETIT